MVMAVYLRSWLIACTPEGVNLLGCYGLAKVKVHKTVTSLRPVLSMPGSAYFKIACQVALWLFHVPECKISSSTKTIVDSLKVVKLDDDEELVSFDVVSLYIPTYQSNICYTTARIIVHLV